MPFVGPAEGGFLYLVGIIGLLVTIIVIVILLKVLGLF